MGLTSALNTSLNGLSLNETAIDVLGNNIANAGTIGFKASKVLFATQLARTLSYGSRPTATDGGTNPRQIGLGASVTAITPDFSQGSISASSSPSDLAIQGDGFFILNSITDGQVYTRNGNFRLDSGDSLSNSQGQRLLGYGVDTNFNLITTTLTSLKIPLGSLHLAQQTSNVVMSAARCRPAKPWPMPATATPPPSARRCLPTCSAMPPWEPPCSHSTTSSTSPPSKGGERWKPSPSR
jgi:flagellar hook protein FlgE